MPDPLVSVLLPVYNAEPYLGTALESILRQDYRPAGDHRHRRWFDGSLASTSWNDIEKPTGAFPIVSRENRGLVATLNEGLTLATGRPRCEDGR